MSKIQKVTLTLRGHYDHHKTASVRADYNGYDYYVSKRSLDAACCRASIVGGDYLEIADAENGMLIVEG